MIKAVIFDCFGVVLTDALETMVAPLRTADPAAVDRIIDAVRKASVGLISSEDCAIVVAAELDITPNEYRGQIRQGEVRNNQLLDYILQLRKRYKIAMLSNVNKGGLLARFEESELEQYFDVVVASGDIGYAKPEAVAYEVTADKLGVRFNECVMVDDRQDYCAGAVGAGMQAVLYQDFEQCKADLERLIHR